MLSGSKYKVLISQITSNRIILVFLLPNFLKTHQLNYFYAVYLHEWLEQFSSKKYYLVSQSPVKTFVSTNLLIQRVKFYKFREIINIFSRSDLMFSASTSSYQRQSSSLTSTNHSKCLTRNSSGGSLMSSRRVWSSLGKQERSSSVSKKYGLIDSITSPSLSISLA